MKKIVRSYILFAVLSGLLFFPSIAPGQKEKEKYVVKNGSVVSFEYTLSDEKGKVIESNKGKNPLTYTHGSGQIIPGLEKGLAGMKVKDQKTVKVKPEDGYGLVDSKAINEVPREQIPVETQKAGATLFARNERGTFPVKVREVKEKTVVLDFNHPLAGKTLSFHVTILDIKPSPAAKQTPPS